MHCYEFENNIISYYEGEISPSVAEAMDKHMNHCKSCRELYGQVTGAYTALDAAVPPPAFRLDAFQAGIEEKLQTTRQNHASLFLRRIPAAAAAVIILAGLAAGIFLGKQIVSPADSSLTSQEAYISSLASDFYIDTDEKYAFDTYYTEEEK